MQNGLFNANSTERSPRLIKQPLLDAQQSTRMTASIIESDNSNELNMAFIADNSISQSVRSECFSISAISKIHSNDRLNSPHYLACEPQISGMDEWPSESISLKANYKRSSPSMEDEGSEELGNHCTKKRINERMKVITINQLSPLVRKKKDEKQRYLLRSRVRAITENDGSSEEGMMGMLSEMEGGKELDETKSKLTNDNQN